MSEHDADRDAIVEVIHRNRVAIWKNDFDMWDSCFVHADYMTRWGWWRGGGTYLLRGWADISARLRADPPPPDFNNAYNTTIEDLSLQIRGDTAWATFFQQYPGHELDDHVGPGRRKELRIFERHDGEWKIALLGVLDGDAGQSASATLRLDPTGRVLWQSPAAMEALAADDDLVVRSGVLHFRSRSLDRQLHDALTWGGTVNTGYLPRNASRPIVVEAGEGLPTKIYWIIVDSGMIQFSFPQHKLDERRLELAAAIYGLSPRPDQARRPRRRRPEPSRDRHYHDRKPGGADRRGCGPGPPTTSVTRRRSRSSGAAVLPTRFASSSGTTGRGNRFPRLSR